MVGGEIVRGRICGTKSNRALANPANLSPTNQSGSNPRFCSGLTMYTCTHTLTHCAPWRKLCISFPVCASPATRPTTNRVCGQQPEEIAQMVVRVVRGCPSAHPWVPRAAHVFMADGVDGRGCVLAEPEFSCASADRSKRVHMVQRVVRMQGTTTCVMVYQRPQG